jgi:hypothetical protein
MNYYVYKLEHLETGEYYIGSRGCEIEPNLDFNYLGSMHVWTPDKSKLIKTILSKYFPNRESAYEYEAKLISEGINDNLNRNYHIPNKGFHVEGLVSVKDKNGKTYCISMNDERFLNGELVSVNSGMVPVKDKDGKTFQVSKSDERYLSGELKHTTTGLVSVKDKDGNISMICKNDERYLNGELVGVHKGTTIVKDKNGNIFRVSINDEKYLNGDLVSIQKGKTAYNKGLPMSEEQKEKLRNPKSEDHKKKLSEVRVGNGTRRVLCIENNTIYNSIKEASINLNLSGPNIIAVLKGKAKKQRDILSNI